MAECHCRYSTLAYASVEYYGVPFGVRRFRGSRTYNVHIAYGKHGVLSEEGIGAAIFSGMSNRLPPTHL